MARVVGTWSSADQRYSHPWLKIRDWSLRAEGCCISPHSATDLVLRLCCSLRGGKLTPRETGDAASGWR